MVQRYARFILNIQKKKKKYNHDIYQDFCFGEMFRI
jgi:hypothetical protein